MYRTNFIACLLTLTCLIVLTPSLGLAQSDKVKTAMAGLKAETTKYGEPRYGYEAPRLHFGDKYISNEMVDGVVKQYGGDATVFVRIVGAGTNSVYLRQATTMKKEDGTSAQWTPLDASNPAFAKLNNREAYYGEVTIFGKTYDAGYEPIIHVPTGQVIGAYFVGYPK